MGKNGPNDMIYFNQPNEIVGFMEDEFKFFPKPLPYYLVNMKYF